MQDNRKIKLAATEYGANRMDNAILAIVSMTLLSALVQLKL